MEVDVEPACRHGACPHWVGRGSMCSCPCHQGCPLGNEESVALDFWLAACSCPGAHAARATVHRVQAEMDALTGRLVAAGQQADLMRKRPRREVRADLQTAFDGQRLAWPSWALDALADVVEAGHGSVLLRLPRLSLLGTKLTVRGASALVRSRLR